MQRVRQSHSFQRYIEEFSHLKLPLSVQGNGPDLAPRDEIHIRDTAPVIVAAATGVELTERGPNKKPVFNFRSEKRSFAKSLRCLIPATHFVEFTTPADPKQKRKDKWRFTLARAEWFCIAGIIRPDAIDQAPCFTMLTTAPGPDVAPYHDRQVVVLQPPDWAAWLDLSRSETELLRPLEPGAIAVARQLPESPTSS